uniref:Uncharacterized protein n=1 Tax=Anguilla anguilla TaxID=7936 RepID=A0A0E9VS58_ANGAN
MAHTVSGFLGGTDHTVAGVQAFGWCGLDCFRSSGFLGGLVHTVSVVQGFLGGLIHTFQGFRGFGWYGLGAPHGRSDMRHSL